MTNIKELIQKAVKWDSDASPHDPEKEPPIPCRGYETNTPDGRDFDCRYTYADVVSCDDCIVNGGRLDPRTGKRFANRRSKS